MKFENLTECARYYLYELLKTNEGVLYSVKQIKDYGRAKSGQDISNNVYSGLLNRESNKDGNGIEKAENQVGYYYYDSTKCKSNNLNEEWLLNTKEILNNTVNELKNELSKANALTADINTLAKLRNTIESLEGLSKTL